jgi:hypothetical protein
VGTTVEPQYGDIDTRLERESRSRLNASWKSKYFYMRMTGCSQIFLYIKKEKEKWSRNYSQ